MTSCKHTLTFWSKEHWSCPLIIHTNFFPSSLLKNPFYNILILKKSIIWIEGQWSDIPFCTSVLQLLSPFRHLLLNLTPPLRRFFTRRHNWSFLMFYLSPQRSRSRVRRCIFINCHQRFILKYFLQLHHLGHLAALNHNLVANFPVSFVFGRQLHLTHYLGNGLNLPNSQCFLHHLAYYFKTIHKFICSFIWPLDERSNVGIKFHFRCKHSLTSNLVFFDLIFLFQEVVERFQTFDGNSPWFFELKSQKSSLHYNFLNPSTMIVLKQL